jgi:hypothetical protein
VSPYHGSRFNGLAWLEDEEDGCHAKLLRTLIYTTKDGWAITVPAGFETDFASIPQALTWLIPALVDVTQDDLEDLADGCNRVYLHFSNGATVSFAIDADHGFDIETIEDEP